MRFFQPAVLATSLCLLSPMAQAVSSLGNFSGWQVFAVSGDNDITPYPDIFPALVGYEGFKVIKFTLAKPLDLRLDLVWKDTTDTVSSAVGMNLAEKDNVVNFALRSADGTVLAATPGPTYFHASKTVPSFYGTLQVPRTTPDPNTGQMYTLSYRETQQSQAQLYKSLPVGDYTVTVYVQRLINGGGYPGQRPHAEVGLYTGPATDFVAYQDALAAPIALGASTAVPGDLSASGITTTTEPNTNTDPKPTVCPVSYTVSTSKALTFTAAVKVSNPGVTPETGWTVNGSFGNATLLYSVKNAKLTQKNGYKSFTATPVAANTTLAAGGSTTFTFSGTKGATLPVLTGLTLTAGGQTCTAVPVAP